MSLVKCFLCLCLVVPAYAQWPPGDDDLLFLFQNCFEEPFALDAAMDEPLLNYILDARGHARYDGNGFMVLGFGRFDAPNQDHLGKAFNSSGAMSLEVWIDPDSIQEGHIMNLGETLALTQMNDQLVITLADATLKATLPKSEGFHLVVSQKGTTVSCFIDGQQVAQATLSGPPKWKTAAPVFGSGEHGKQGWQGVLGHFALYEGPTDVARAAAHFKAHQFLLPGPSKPLELTGKLIAKSKVATPKEIDPYAASLAIYEYEIVKVHAGFNWDKKVRVAHWVVLDHQQLPAADAEIGALHRMLLEPFSANRQLANLHRTETLPIDPDIRLYLATNILASP